MKNPSRFGLLLAACLSSALQAGAKEPPDQPGLTCAVTSQSLADGLLLGVTLGNESVEEVSLTPGPHLVLYRDAAANHALGITARVDRVQNIPLLLPAQSSRTVLFSVESSLTQALRCNEAPSAAAGLYFYQYNRVPQFRCLLQGFRPDTLPLNPTCVRASSVTSEVWNK